MFCWLGRCGRAHGVTVRDRGLHASRMGSRSYSVGCETMLVVGRRPPRIRGCAHSSGRQSTDHPIPLSSTFFDVRTEAVCTDMGAVRKMIDECVTGNLVRIRDSAAPAERLVVLLTDDEGRHATGTAARKRVETEFADPEASTKRRAPSTNLGWALADGGCQWLQ
jgi:hypothetical protein